MNKNTRILIVEDDPLIAEDIAGHLQTSGYQNLRMAYTPQNALQALDEDKIEFVLLDIHLESNVTGVQLAQKINNEYHIPFIYITSFADPATIREVKSTYPVGYILKPFNEKEIIAVMEIGYELYYTFIGKPDELDEAKLARICSETLTGKELEVLYKIAEGKTNKQIADELFVSMNTVKTHLKNVFVKMDVSSRSEAIVLLNKAKITR